ncbi:tctex1 domain-containing protein 3 isoform X1 [Notechis scutatus]|uniref:Tctex1 domain-containing protein 3 isoform X1 n=1 Tax=Notechis scutatus TaxID=8663 RepID=A0A6J1U9Z1_9SAUR|nr:tctex1 domain-containing protein 3 isoform X1 [Notechis scutatus]
MDKAKKKLGVTPSHAGQAWGRKHSNIDKDQLGRPSVSGKHRASSYDISGMDPDDESVTDFTKNELLVFKTSFARQKYGNTYRMEPYRKCEAHIVRKRAEDILKQKLQDFKYIGINGAPTCTAISEDILAGVKDLGFDRYKYIVQLFLVQKTGQSIHIASRWVWDVARDTWVQAQYETENYIMVALVVASYFE